MAKQKVSQAKGYDLSKNFQFRPAGGGGFGGPVHPWEQWLQNALPTVNKKGEEEQNPQFLRLGTPDEVASGVAQFSTPPDSPKAAFPKKRAYSVGRDLQVQAWEHGLEIQWQVHTMTVQDDNGNDIEVVGIAYQCQEATEARKVELAAAAHRRRHGTKGQEANGDGADANGDDTQE